MKTSGLILTVLSLVAYHSYGVQLDSHDKMLASHTSQFALKFFKELRADEGNLLFSPLSAHIALSMAYAGSANETQKEMASVLFESGWNTTGYNRLLQSLLTYKHGLSLHLANKMFADKSRKVKNNFRVLLKRNFVSDAEQLDFQGEAEKSRKHINRWVERQTNYKIHDLLQKGDVTPDLVTVLVNALYFRGNWSVAFPKENTRPRTFKLNSKSNQEVDMMSVTNYFNYAKFPGFQILSLDYQGNETAMVIALPTDVDGLQKLEEQLPEIPWELIEHQMENKTKLTVTLPKFKLEKSMDLVPFLRKMGMNRAFDRMHAEFPEVSSLPTYINKVVQKTFIEVDEIGTEAAASTYVGGAIFESLEINPKFTADHPFLFFIYNKPSQTVLFMGRYSQPA